MNNFDIPQEEVDKIFKEMIIPQILYGVTPSVKKEALILGGQPGSGKSACAREILKLDNNIVFINGDDLRAYHPKYYFYLKENDIEAADMTQPVSNFWIEELIKECIQRRLSMIIEGTMRNKNVPMTTARILKDNNYNINLAVVSAPYEISLMSLEYRYKELKRLGEFGRYTKKESHDEAFKNINGTLIELSNSGFFNKFYVYNRVLNGFKENVFESFQKEEMLKIFNDGRTRLVENSEKDFSRFVDGEKNCFKISK